MENLNLGLNLIEDNEDYFDYLKEALGINEDEISILRKIHKEDRPTS